MSKSIKVFKFGGASVKDAEAIKNVANILKKHRRNSILVVVSAMGKTTNALEKVVQAYFDPAEDATELLLAIKNQHLEVAKELMGENSKP